METWKDIPGFPGYQASNLGRIRTHDKITHTDLRGFRHWKDRVLKPKVHRKDHYARVNVWRDGRDYTRLVHRLVAEAFLGIPEGKMTVNHKDGNKANNCIDNLEWMSLGDNIRHGFRTGLYPTCHEVTLISIDGTEHVYPSKSQAGLAIGRTVGYISESVHRGSTIRGSDGMTYLIKEIA